MNLESFWGLLFHKEFLRRTTPRAFIVFSNFFEGSFLLFVNIYIIASFTSVYCHNPYLTIYNFSKPSFNCLQLGHFQPSGKSLKRTCIFVSSYSVPQLEHL